MLLNRLKCNFVKYLENQDSCEFVLGDIISSFLYKPNYLPPKMYHIKFLFFINSLLILTSIIRLTYYWYTVIAIKESSLYET